MVFQHHFVTWAIALVWLLLSAPAVAPSTAGRQAQQQAATCWAEPPCCLRFLLLFFAQGNKCLFSKISAGAGQSWEACWALSLPAGSRGSSRLLGADAGSGGQKPRKNALHPGFTGAENQAWGSFTSSGVWGTAESSRSCLVATVDVCGEPYVRKCILTYWEILALGFIILLSSSFLRFYTEGKMLMVLFQEIY